MLEYEVNEKHRSITPCPEGMLNDDDNIIMVGSKDCSQCMYCFDIYKKKHLVNCATQISTTYNITPL
jgi:hypothetical protein